MKLCKKFYFVAFYDTGQMAQVVRSSLLVRGFKSWADLTHVANDSPPLQP